MSKPIINIDEIALEPPPAAFAPAGPATERYQRRTGMIAPRIGARLLGYNITAVPPGKRAFSFSTTSFCLCGCVSSGSNFPYTGALGSSTSRTAAADDTGP